MNIELHQMLLNNPPKFHFWGGLPQLGGMGPLQLKMIERCAERNAEGIQRVAIETGAGLSTLWLLNLGYQVYSFCLGQPVLDKISAFLEDYPALKQNWHPIEGASEITLPTELVVGKKVPRAGLCLMDGGHGLQTVLVDFVYLNFCLAKNGVLLLDDLQIGAPKLLYHFLKGDRNFAEFETTAKLGSFVKRNDIRLLPDWGAQRDILERIGTALGPVQPSA
jgi:hypothetical protein